MYLSGKEQMWSIQLIEAILKWFGNVKAYVKALLKHCSDFHPCEYVNPPRLEFGAIPCGGNNCDI